MALVVTGLSHHGDLEPLKAALSEAGLTVDSLQVISPGEGAGSVTSGLAGSEIVTGDSGTGTGVPGINSSHRLRTFFRNESVDERLGDLDIPDSEAGNYVEALERGRTLVAYYARPESVDRVEAAFRGSGLLNVRRF
jgi:hypothetical protein